MPQATAPGPLGDSNDLFVNAKRDFLLVLSPEERAVFANLTTQTTADTLIDEAKRITDHFKDKSRSFRVNAQISAFSESIRPYFEILGIVVSSHPEWAAIAWGALRLILQVIHANYFKIKDDIENEQLASNYTSFFEKLADLLAELSRTVPRFKELAELVGNDSDASLRIRAVLQGFYTNLFELFCAVALVFTKKSGKPKATLRVTSRLMSSPFDSKFQNIIAKIEIHKKTIEDELQILTLRKFVDFQNSLKDQAQTATKIKDELRSQICSTEELLKAIHTLNELTNNQGHALAKQLAEYRQQQQKEQSSPRHSRKDILEFLDPPEDFAQQLEDASRLRDPGSGLWIFSEPDFVEWRKSSSASTLWIKGKPGCGKSILASGIIENLPSLCMAGKNGRPHIFYFFFSTRSLRPQSNDAACRAILAQILDCNDSDMQFHPAFDYAMSKRKQGQIRATSGIIWDLLVISLDFIPGSFIVLDGIDECVVPNAMDTQEQNNFLARFLNNLQSDLRGSQSKILFLSRPGIWQMGPLISQGEIKSIHITPERNGGDLRRYCATRLQSLISEGLLPLQDPKPMDNLIETLLTGADGMFLWARLMFSYLRSPYLAPHPSIAAKTRLRHIETLRYPETLDTMYLRILNLIGRFDNHLRSQARRTFRWLLFSKRHRLAAMELHDILTVTSWDENFDEETAKFIQEFDCDESFRVMDESIIAACSSLVELSMDSEGHFYRFIHQTAIEFFLKRYGLQDSIKSSSRGEGSLLETFSQPETLEPGAYTFFFICPTEVGMELTTACIKYLQKRIAPGPLSGNILQTASRPHVTKRFPFLSYASSFWTAHLRDSHPECPHNTYHNNVRALEKNLTVFLDARYTIMTWIEAMWLLAKPVDIFQHCPNISQWVSCNRNSSLMGLEVCNNLEALCHDLQVLEREWGVNLRNAPDQIWNDITAYIDSRFLVQTSGTRVQSLAPRSLGTPSQSSKSLSTISVSDTADSCMAVLSIWPSKDFESTWYLVSETENTQQLSSVCHGWVARYELWNTKGESPIIILNHTEYLDPSEVRLQIQHFLQRSPRRDKSALDVDGVPRSSMQKLAVSFPTTISCHDLSLFMVLRTIFKISQSTIHSSGTDTRSFRVPLDFNENMKAIWGSQDLSVATQLVNDNTDATWAAKKISYTYSFEFSHGNKYLLYRDTAGMTVLPKVEMRLATTLAMFQLSQSMSWGGPQVRFLSQLESKPPEHYYSSWAIHPELPIMAIFDRSEKRSPVMLWDFEDTAQLRIENPSSLSLPGTISNMSFSECGRSLVIQRLGFPHPSIKSIEKCVSFKRRQNKAQRRQPTQSAQSLVHRTATVGDIVAYDTGILRSGQVQHFVGPDGRQVSQQIEVTAVGVSGIGIVQTRSGRDGDVTIQQPIVAVPSTETVSILQANMQLPQSNDEPLRVIVNKCARDLYNLDDEQDRHFPAVISKHQKALRAGERKREVGESSVTGQNSKSMKKIKH